MCAAAFAVVVLIGLTHPGPRAKLAALAIYSAGLASAWLATRWRLHRTPTATPEHQLWAGTGRALLAGVLGVVVIVVGDMTDGAHTYVPPVLGVLLLTAVALNYLGIIRWTSPSELRSRVDPDHLVATVCCALVLVSGALLAATLWTGVPDLARDSRFPVVVSAACGLVEAAVLAGTTRRWWRRDLRPALLTGALVVGVAISTTVLAISPPDLLPWALLPHAVWATALALCALLPPVAHPRDRHDVALSSTSGFVAVLLALPVAALAAQEGLGLVAVVATAALLGSAARLLLDVRELRQLLLDRRASLTDDLTGLASRRGVHAALERALAERRPLVVAVLDLTRFKEVNDALGHAAGDQLLRTVADRLRSVLQTGEVAGRLGGDEFVLVAPCGPRTTPDARAAALAAGITCSLGAPVPLGALVVQVEASTGTATWQPPSSPSSPEDDDDAGALAARLLRAADAAMHDAKRSGEGWVPHDPSRHDDTAGQLALVADLRTALVTGQLVLHHQPQVLATTGQPVGVEALVRWQHPRLGLLGPVAFLDLAEAHGLMGLLTEEVLRGGVAQLGAWRRSGLVLRMALNLPASALHDVDLPRRVGELLLEHGVPASSLVLEVTETVLLRDVDRSSAVVQALRSSGVRVSIDDFGTGHSSLARLQKLPVDELKLDGSFTRELLVDERARTIVAGTVAMAHALGLSVVAEGVEDAETLRALQGLGCDEAQGYLFSRPVPAADLPAWWRERGGAIGCPAEGGAEGFAADGRSLVHEL